MYWTILNRDYHCHHSVKILLKQVQYTLSAGFRGEDVERRPRAQPKQCTAGMKFVNSQNFMKTLLCEYEIFIRQVIL